MRKNQFGFQKGPSTTDALVKFSLENIRDLNIKKRIDCVALHLTKAFDKCWPDTIIKQLNGV